MGFVLTGDTTRTLGKKSERGFRTSLLQVEDVIEEASGQGEKGGIGTDLLHGLWFVHDLHRSGQEIVFV